MNKGKCTSVQCEGWGVTCRLPACACCLFSLLFVVSVDVTDDQAAGVGYGVVFGRLGGLYCGAAGLGMVVSGFVGLLASGVRRTGVSLFVCWRVSV